MKRPARPPPSPGDPTATLRSVVAMLGAGKTDQARTTLQRLLQRHPGHGDANHLMAMAMLQAGQPEAAEYYVRRAIAAEPRRAQFHGSLGNILCNSGRVPEGTEAYRRAIEIDPGYGPAYIGLSRVQLLGTEPDSAVETARRGVELAGHLFEAHVNYCSALSDVGRLEEAVDALRRARERFPDHADLQSTLVPLLMYSTRATPDQIAEEHRLYGRLVARDWPPMAPPPNDPDPERPLRIAYLSPDLREHSVAYFLLAALEHRDRERYRVHCYPTAANDDVMTRRLRGLADAWVPAAALSIEATAQRLRSDRIDVLVELTGHTAGQRLPVLARRPCPVQVTYIGYPATTGTPNVDYRIVDSRTDPPGHERYATERLVRLDPCFLCYTPPAGAPDPVPPPSLEAGRVTFGSFNALQKLNPAVVALWAGVLGRVPGSRLLLKCRSFADARVRERVVGWFHDAGLEPARVEALEPTGTTAEHLAQYARVDIALDPFPYNGTTTTCEALWMGVPVVTLEGAAHAGRVGASLLGAVGLQELVARSEDEYVRLAAGLAADRQRLGAWRSSLRERLARSPLCDGPAYAARLHEAYRAMWREWCAARRAT